MKSPAEAGLKASSNEVTSGPLEGSGAWSSGLPSVQLGLQSGSLARRAIGEPTPFGYDVIALGVKRF
jgi:hypothetical protein